MIHTGPRPHPSLAHAVHRPPCPDVLRQRPQPLTPLCHCARPHYIQDWPSGGGVKDRLAQPRREEEAEREADEEVEPLTKVIWSY